MIQLVSLLARAGHGKTTLARHLQDTYGTETVSLATALKKTAKVVMNFSDEQLWGTQEQKETVDPRYGFSARIFLQRLGTEGMRTFFGENIHLEGMIEEIRRRVAEMKQRADAFGGNHRPPVFVCDDTRFKNESRYIRNLHRATGNHRPSDGVGGIDGAGTHPSTAIMGTVIKIICTDAPPSGNDNHPSEREIDEIAGGMIDAEIVSSRAHGTAHLIQEFENVLALPKLRAVRVALDASQRFRDSLRSFGV